MGFERDDHGVLVGIEIEVESIDQRIGELNERIEAIYRLIHGIAEKAGVMVEIPPKYGR